MLDDRSANGTYVNGRRVIVAELADGDIVALGCAVFRYHDLTVVRRRRLLWRFAVVSARESHQSPSRC